MNTNDDRGDLLRPLRDIDGADGPPPRYDVALAMRQGDSIRRRRMSIGAVAAIVVVGAAIGIPLGLPSPHQAGPAPSTPVPSPAPSTSVPSPAPSASVPPSSLPVPLITSAAELPVANCTVTTLTAPAGAGAFSTWGFGRIDPTGRYLAVSLFKPTTPTQFTPGKPLLVDLRTGGMTLIPVAEGKIDGVNADGVVIGYSGANAAGWVFRNGTVTPLPKFHGVAGTPYAINAVGDVVGQVIGVKNEPGVIWPADRPGTVRALLPAGMVGSTITDSGLIGGSIGDAEHPRPYVGDGNGTGHTLSTGATDPLGQVREIRGNYAVGWGFNNVTKGMIPMVWNLATNARTPYPRVGLIAIATDGTVVGETVPDSGVPGPAIGLIGRGGALERLPSGAGDNLSIYVDDVSADGHTVFGQRRTSSNTSDPLTAIGLLWHC
jgi:hypothetical protein